MILDAVHNNVDMTKLKEMIAGVKGLGGGAGSALEEEEVDEFKSGLL
jgi:hypothetical protein